VIEAVASGDMDEEMSLDDMAIFDIQAQNVYAVNWESVVVEGGNSQKLVLVSYGDQTELLLQPFTVILWHDGLAQSSHGKVMLYLLVMLSSAFARHGFGVVCPMISMSCAAASSRWLSWAGIVKFCPILK